MDNGCDSNAGRSYFLQLALCCEVVLLRFGHDYDPECKLTDDILLALSDDVKEGWT